MRYTHAMEDAKRRAVEAIAQRQSLNQGSSSEEGGRDARGPSKSDRATKTAVGPSEGMKAAVKDAEECSYEISRDRSVTNEKRRAVGSS